eukprot:CAMPEP_0116005312 /NCGR_PEP_ID=MMETSP0321-20121206/1099_1 /TAXON_ID=163516 /ORGANISM="Leptocylindrus danicus var. danicus, Strain B650" /LENGTH=213 /DNA_ID=CAMNT_0003473733 /DNA_START=99 /DNA_END=740 /DNA_ORIENTATION=+
MTVEELLYAIVEDETQKMHRVVNESNARLDREWEVGKAELLELKKIAVEKKRAKQAAAAALSAPLNDKENNKQQEIASTEKSKETKKKPAAKKGTAKSCPLKLVALSGPHKDEEFFIRPTLRVPCVIGRSKAKKYVDKGVSLNQDDQVSTMHGEFIFKSGQAMFVDVGSTNGSSVMKDGEELWLEKGHETIVPQDGSLMLRVGDTILKVEYCA